MLSCIYWFSHVFLKDMIDVNFWGWLVGKIFSDSIQNITLWSSHNKSNSIYQNFIMINTQLICFPWKESFDDEKHYLRSITQLRGFQLLRRPKNLSTTFELQREIGIIEREMLCFFWCFLSASTVLRRYYFLLFFRDRWSKFLFYLKKKNNIHI